mgnify:CR=1 FL=1
MRIAVFIDAENIASGFVPEIIARLEELGEIATLRAIGKFGSGFPDPWISSAAAHGIDLDLQPSVGTGKNGADIAIAVEAMSAALSGRFDAVAIASGDADFTPLAFRLRRLGLLVYGFARQTNCSGSFPRACTRFTYLRAAPLASVPLPVNPSADTLTKKDRQRLDALLRKTPSHPDGMGPGELGKLLKERLPQLHARLSRGKGMVHNLRQFGGVAITGSGATCRITATGPQSTAA